MKRTKHYQMPKLIIRVLFLFILTLGFNNKISAQTELSKVNLYAEFGAVPGVEALMNIEVRIKSGENITWYGRAGLGSGGILLATGGPGMLGAITMLTRKGNNHFDLSGGAFIGYDTYYEDPFVIPSLDIGYRFQKPDGGFLFKAKAGILGIGFGLGYAF